MSEAAIATRPLALGGRLLGDGNWRRTFEVLGTGTTWTAMTMAVRGAAWRRGAPGDPEQRPETGTCTITLDNRDKTWLPATTPYDDEIRPGKPGTLVRICDLDDPLAGYVVPDGETHLTVEHDAATYAPLDFQVVVRLAADDWTFSPSRTIASRLSSSLVGWQFRLSASLGELQLIRRETTTDVTFTSTANLSALANGAEQWVAVTYDADNGASGQSARFWTSTNGSTWTQLGTTVTVAGVAGTMNVVAPSPVKVGMGASSLNGVAGRYYRFEYRLGIAAGGAVSTTAPLAVLVDMTTLPSTPHAVDRGWFRADTGQRVMADSTAAVTSPPLTVFAFTVGTTWVPQFTGRVESWVETTSALGRERFVTIELQETVGWLAGVDKNAVPSLQGGGESPALRFDRLLDDAGWTYGFHVDYAVTPTPTLQSTDLAENRLAELHLTADSSDLWFRSHRSGVAVVTETDARHHRTPSQPASATDKSIKGRATRDMYPDGIVFHPNGRTSAPAPFVAPSPWFNVGSGKYLSVADSATLDITGDITIAAEVSFDDYTPTTDRIIAAKRVEGTNQRSWALILTTTGLLQLRWSTDGVNYQTRTSSVAVGLADRQRAVLAATLDVSNGGNHVVRFFVSPLDVFDAGNVAGGWDWDTTMQLGTTSTTAGTTSIFASTAPVTLCGDPGGTVASPTGRLHRLFITGGTIAADGLPSSVSARLYFEPGGRLDVQPGMPDDDTVTSFTIGGSSSVTVVGSAVMVDPTPVVYDADSFRTANDLFGHLSDVAFARVGGTEQVETNLPVRQQIGPRTRRRNDLICSTDAQTLELAKRIRRRWSSQVYRPTGCRVTSRPGNFVPMIALDIGDLVEVIDETTVDPSHGRLCSITAMSHQMTALRPGRFRWVCDYEFAAYINT